MRAPDCHPDRRYRARGMCDRCYWKWCTQNNPEYVARQRQNVRDWRKRNPGRKRAPRPKEQNRRKTLRRHGLTTAQFQQMLSGQNGRCALCNKVPSGCLHVDHCHRTGRVRGLLCVGCNVTLGKIELWRPRLAEVLAYADSAPFPSALVIFRRQN